VIIPWGTDAPLYHRPIATIGVMVGCVLAFAADPGHEHTEYLLALGDGVHPIQWVTNIFLHGNVVHLLGNLLFLWTFGIVVEGKLGAFGFLAAFVAMGAFQSGLMQTFADPGGARYAMGASGAIYGLMALCMIWAPRNVLYCLVILSGFMRLLVFQPEIPILWFSAFYIGWEVMLASLWKLSASSALAHATGALGGVILGLSLLKLNLVDCEGWDLISRMRLGRAEKKRPGRPPEKRARKKAKKPRRSGEDPDVVALRTLRGHLDAEETEAAIGFYRDVRRKRPSWRPPDPERLELVKALLAAGWWEDAAGVMRAYLDESRLPSPRIHLRLADVLIRRLDRPVAGLRTLESLPASDLPADLAAVRRKLEAMARRLQEDGALELDEPVRAI